MSILFSTDIAGLPCPRCGASTYSDCDHREGEDRPDILDAPDPRDSIDRSRPGNGENFHKRRVKINHTKGLSIRKKSR